MPRPEWHSATSIHLTTVKDLRNFCTAQGLVIEHTRHLTTGWPVRTTPNLRAKLAIFVVRKV